MTTSVQQILDAASDRSTFNDAALLNLPRTIAYLDRLVKKIYGEASAPIDHAKGGDTNGYFAERTTLALTGAFVALPALVQTAMWLPPDVLTAAGVRVQLISQIRYADGYAETPPAVLYEKRQLSPTGRAGDPIAGDVLTLIFTRSPGPLTDAAHYIGATTPTDLTTTLWPDQPGNEALIADLAHYLATKDGGADSDAEMVKLEKEKGTLRGELLAFLRAT